MDSHLYKHGGKSKHALPERLAARVQLYENDDKAFELKSNMALLRARRDELVSLLDTGESGSIWSELQTAYANLVEANKVKDVEAMNGILLHIGSLIERGASDADRWMEVLDVLDRERKLAESDAKIKSKLNQYMTVDQGMALVNFVKAANEQLIYAYLPKDQADRFLDELSDALESGTNREPGRAPTTVISGRARAVARPED